MASPVKPVLGQTPWATVSEEPPKRRGSFALIALLLLAIIGGAGYRVYPALQEIWQRSHSREPMLRLFRRAQPSSVATPDVTSADGNPADKSSADATTVPAAPTVSSPAVTPTDSTPSALAASPQRASSRKCARTRARKSTNRRTGRRASGIVLTRTSTSAPVPPAATPVAAPVVSPTASSTAQLPASAKPPVRRKAVAPQASQIAMEWKDLIRGQAGVQQHPRRCSRGGCWEQRDTHRKTESVRTWQTAATIEVRTTGAADC